MTTWVLYVLLLAIVIQGILSKTRSWPAVAAGILLALALALESYHVFSQGEPALLGIGYVTVAVILAWLIVMEFRKK